MDGGLVSMLPAEYHQEGMLRCYTIRIKINTLKHGASLTFIMITHSFIAICRAHYVENGESEALQYNTIGPSVLRPQHDNDNDNDNDEFNERRTNAIKKL